MCCSQLFGHYPKCYDNVKHQKPWVAMTCYAGFAKRVALAWNMGDILCCSRVTHGMTEMGLGGAAQCEAGLGYHLQEGDLYFEIVHPETGAALPDGALGEVVFTTLTRQGMPLVCYRTGDLSRFIPEPCPCGSVLRSMEIVRPCQIKSWLELLQVNIVSFTIP